MIQSEKIYEEDYNYNEENNYYDDSDYIQDGKIGFEGKPVCNLQDGNAFAILGKVSKALKLGGCGHLVDAFQTEARSGNYDNLLRIAMKYCDINIR